MAGPRGLLAATVLALFGSVAPAFAQEPARNGYLRAVYSWQVPMLPNCGTPEPFSTEVPFIIRGKTIEGIKTIDDFNKEVIRVLPTVEDPDLVDVFAMPDDPAQVIEYRYTCGACNVSGTVVIHGVRGQVRTFGGDEMLHFFVTFSNPVCKVDCYNLDCSDNERVVDEFMTPVEDMHLVERPVNAIFKYLLRLE
ncbi:MAG: hypothetical protein OEM24_11330 [Paracoccaceae bacterium]|nr:hypothetical protein [Paracoccaceae bacterium]